MLDKKQLIKVHMRLLSARINIRQIPDVNLNWQVKSFSNFALFFIVMTKELLCKF